MRSLSDNEVVAINGGVSEFALGMSLTGLAYIVGGGVLVASDYNNVSINFLGVSVTGFTFIGIGAAFTIVSLAVMATE